MHGANVEAQPFDDMIHRVSLAIKAQRTAAAMSDDVVELAARLPEDSTNFARLKANLQGLGVRVSDWMKVVHNRREELGFTAGEEEADGRPQIVINTLEEFQVNERAIKAIAPMPNVYQRFGLLVRVVDMEHRRPGEAEPYTTPEITEFSQPLLRELFTQAASWHEERYNPQTGQPKLVRAHPPDWCVKAVHGRRRWPGIKPLYCLAEAPVLLPDGTIVSTPGYDERSGILYRPRLDFPAVPEEPTEEDVREATERLLDILRDFPFDIEERRSAWFAALLTPIARWAFKNQSPMFILDANQSGSGKGLLLKLISWIVLGREMDFLVPTENEEEERKRITSKILKGEPMVMIDNIDKPFGSPVLEGLLTTGVWSDRLLGTNDAPSLDAWITWYGSGNNIQFKREDTRRRSCVIRIQTDDPRPEERSGFKYPDLHAHVLEHRAELYAAALTILRGWIRTGKKASELPGWGGPWGSYDGWDQVVRGAILYAGLPDPIATKATKDGMEATAIGHEELVDGFEDALKQLVREGKVKEDRIKIHDVFTALVEEQEWRRVDRNITPGSRSCATRSPCSCRS